MTAVLIAVDGVGRAGGPVARVGLLGGVSVGSSRGCFFVSSITHGQSGWFNPFEPPRTSSWKRKHGV